MKIRGGECPTCGKPFAGDIESRGRAHQPRAGDMGVCLTCGTMLTFVKEGNELVRRLATPEQIEGITPEDMAQMSKVHRFLARKHQVSGPQS